MTTCFLGILYHMLMKFYKPGRMNCNYFQSYQCDQQKEKNCYFGELHMQHNFYLSLP
jgi:hypothetical protein